MEKAFAAKIYYSASENFKDIYRYLFFCEKKVKKGEWIEIFPSILKISKACHCSERTVQRFIKSVKGFPIDITERVGDTYIFKMHREFFDWMLWADLKNLLYATKDQVENILKQCERLDAKSTLSPPLSSMRCHPTLTLSQTRIKEKGIHPYLEKIQELSFKEKLSLSQHCESAIVGAVENYQRFRRMNKIETPFGLMISYIERRKRKGL